MIECEHTAFETKQKAFHHNQIKICTFHPIIRFPSKQKIQAGYALYHQHTDVWTDPPATKTFAVAQSIFSVEQFSSIHFFVDQAQSRCKTNGRGEFISVYFYWVGIQWDAAKVMNTCDIKTERVYLCVQTFSQNTSRERICICIFHYCVCCRNNSILTYVDTRWYVISDEI